MIRGEFRVFRQDVLVETNPPPLIVGVIVWREVVCMWVLVAMRLIVIVRMAWEWMRSSLVPQPQVVHIDQFLRETRRSGRREYQSTSISLIRISLPLVSRH